MTNGQRPPNGSWRESILIVSLLLAIVYGYVSPVAKMASDAMDRVAYIERRSTDQSLELAHDLATQLAAIEQRGTERNKAAIAEVRDLRDRTIEQQQSLQEIETQFRAQWMAMNIENQTYERLLAVLWNKVYEGGPSLPQRDYWPDMSHGTADQ